MFYFLNEQVESLSEPVNRDRVERIPSAAAVSAAANVRIIIPRKSSLDKENWNENIVAKIKEVASRLKIIIKIWARCFMALMRAINEIIRRRAFI